MLGQTGSPAAHGRVGGRGRESGCGAPRTARRPLARTSARPTTIGRAFSPPMRLTAWISAFYFFFASACTSQPQSEPGPSQWPAAQWLPMSRDPLPKIQVVIRMQNGSTVEGSAVIDTGSLFGAILPVRYAPDGGEGASTVAHGASGAVPLQSAGTVEIVFGDIVVKDVRAAVGPVDRIIIGAGCLARLDGIVFDWEGKRFGILPNGTESKADADWEHVTLFESEHDNSFDPFFGVRSIHQPFFEAQVDSRPVLALLDTGSSSQIVFRGNPPATESAKKMRARSLGGMTETWLSRTPRTLTIGGLPPQKVYATWLGERAKWNAEVVVGLGALRHRALWIDYEAGVARFSRAQ